MIGKLRRAVAGDPPTAARRHLIIVCCHGVYIGPGGAGDSAGMRDEDWIMEPGQGNEGLTLTEHLKKGIAELERDLENSILVFSGGATKTQTPKSEALSYYDLAIHRNLISPAIRPSIITEPFALDSYENIIYSLVRYYQYTSWWPTHITLLSHAFKERRFAGIHIPAARWPLERLHYVGIDPVGKPQEELQAGERWACVVWGEDPYAGGVGKVGQRRGGRGQWKEARNPWKIQAPYLVTCPELEPFIEWAGGKDRKTVYPDPLPWDI